MPNLYNLRHASLEAEMGLDIIVGHCDCNLHKDFIIYDFQKWFIGYLLTSKSKSITKDQPERRRISQIQSKRFLAIGYKREGTGYRSLSFNVNNDKSMFILPSEIAKKYLHFNLIF